MNRIVIIVAFFTLVIFSGIRPLYAQSDSIRKQARSGKKATDSEKNKILNEHTDEFQSANADQLSDSIRLLQLKYELLKLGSHEEAKKRSIVTEADQIKIKDSLRKILQRRKIDSIRSVFNGYPVVLASDTIFFVFAKVGIYSPEDRAEVISERINKLADDYYFKEDSLAVVTAELSVDINYKDETIVSISELDAVWMNSTKEMLAENYKKKIIAAIRNYKETYGWPTLIKDFAMAMLVLLALIVIIFSVNKIFKWIHDKIEKQRGDALRGFKIRGYEFLDTNHQLTLIFSVARILKWIIIITLIYLSLPVIFGIFPWTGQFSGQLISYFLSPVKHILISIWHYLPNFLTIIVLIIFFRYLIRILSYFKKEIENGALIIPGFYVDWANPTFQIIRVLVLAFALIVIFPYLPGSDSQVFKGVSVFLGVLFTFGSAGALSNVVAGLVLTYMRAYRIGDRVKIGEATGDVVEKSLLVTRIKTIKNEIVSIPNSTVMNSHTTNFSAEAKEHGLIIHTTVTIGYENPWRQIHELLIKAALATEFIEKEPAPFVLQTSLDDFYVRYQINAYTSFANEQQNTYSLLHQNIQDMFNEANVEIMSAHYKYIRDGNRSTVPADHLPDDYVAPAFRVRTENKD
jgi:small-conductance mechanosensitive channel